MFELISIIENLKNDENYLVEFYLGIELPGEQYQSYRCFSSNDHIKINTENEIIIFKVFVQEPLNRLNRVLSQRFNFAAKLKFENSKIIFSADYYKDPSAKFILTMKRDGKNYFLKGKDDLEDIIIRFYYSRNMNT